MCVRGVCCCVECWLVWMCCCVRVESVCVLLCGVGGCGCVVV